VEVNYSAGQGISNFSTPAMDETNEGEDAEDYAEFGTTQSTSIEKAGKEPVYSPEALLEGEYEERFEMFKFNVPEETSQGCVLRMDAILTDEYSWLFWFEASRQKSVDIQELADGLAKVPTEWSGKMEITSVMKAVLKGPASQCRGR
jgi:hypothetical protein